MINDPRNSEFRTANSANRVPSPQAAIRYSGARRRGRAGVTVLLVIVGLAAGAVGGYWVPKRWALGGSPSGMTSAVSSAGTATSDDETWYTCGMHPNVLQKGPGDCPICHMKLTPLQKESQGGEGEAPGRSKERKVLYWRAPMDPNYISEKPGKSPMGMNLVPVYADEEESVSAHAIHINPITIQNMGIRTTVIRRGPLVKTIRTVGRVDYDEQLVTFIDTKFNGWIEKLYVDETGQHVNQGQLLFDVYSPELYAAQQEYLSAVQNLPHLEKSTLPSAREDAVKMVEAAVIKLRYLDVSNEQIETLKRTGVVEKTLRIHSPATGIVTEKMALEGMYVKPGMRLYTIADLSRVWVYVDVYEYQLPWIRVGQTATMVLPYVPGRTYTGTVVYVYPYLEERTRVIKVRLEFENPASELMPGMFANVRLESQIQRDALLVPREAYIDSGTRQVAFVYLGDGEFAPRDIQVGVEAEDGMVEVLYGLDEGEVVVSSGQFMLDAESKLKEAVAKMMKAERAKSTKRITTAPAAGEGRREPAAPAEPEQAATIPLDAAYACPMEAHPDEDDPAQRGPYFSRKPGTCPRCGMKLKPLDDLDWVRVRRAAPGGDVAYTCPQHQHVFSEKPGKCPRCGRKLMPFRVMYTCPNPEHAGVISASPGNCPRCGRGLTAFRSIWLDESMADENIPPDAGLAATAPYHCPVHPLVHSDKPGKCTICGAALQATRTALSSESPRGPKPTGLEEYVCPMHPDTQRASRPGTCRICGMQLVKESALKRPQAAPEHIAAQMSFILEHYLEIQKLLASDRTKGLALHALGLASASEALMKHIQEPSVKLPREVTAAAQRLHAAALQMTGRLTADRVTFIDLSAAVRILVEHARPDRKRWPKLYIYHCPMSKGDWLQASKDKANPYYGFKMLKCGEPRGIR